MHFCLRVCFFSLFIIFENAGFDCVGIQYTNDEGTFLFCISCSKIGLNSKGWRGQRDQAAPVVLGGLRFSVIIVRA